MKVRIKKVANIVAIVEARDTEHIIKTWNEAAYTERKLSNYIKKNNLQLV